MKAIKDLGLALGALCVCVVSQIVYLLTLTRTCPFWDTAVILFPSMTTTAPGTGDPPFPSIRTPFSITRD